METRELGRTGIKVTLAGVGCWAIGGPFSMGGEGPSGWGKVDDEESIRMIHRALDRGARFFDTAENYGWSHSEEVLGRALAGRREEAVVASKLGHYHYRTSGADYPFYSRRHIREALEGSLKRLRRDCLDVYLFHRTPADLGWWDEAAQAMEQLKEEGKIRAWGISAYGPKAVAEFPALNRLDVLEPNYNLADREEEESLALAQARRLGVIARGPLAMGLLTGKFKADTAFAPDDIRGTQPRFRGEKYARRLEFVERVRQLLAPGETLAELAVRFVLSHPAVSVVIAGAKTPAQIEESLRAAARGPLPADRLAALKALPPPE